MPKTTNGERKRDFKKTLSIQGIQHFVKKIAASIGNFPGTVATATMLYFFTEILEGHYGKSQNKLCKCSLVFLFMQCLYSPLTSAKATAL